MCVCVYIYFHIELIITVDNYLQALYFDGIRVPNSMIPYGNDDQWKVPDVVPLPVNVTLIALQVKNAETQGYAGILASASSGNMITNSQWKCLATVTSNDWMMPSYDDASWPAAVEIFANFPGTWPWANIPSINPLAQWIWTTSQPTTQQIIYCRLKTSET